MTETLTAAREEDVRPEPPRAEASGAPPRPDEGAVALHAPTPCGWARNAGGSTRQRRRGSAG